MAKRARDSAIPSKTTSRKLTFDLDALRERAGAKAFARGEVYFREGQVQILDLGAERVLAVVSGSEDYRTEVIGRGQSIAGSCNCPAFADWGSCKHMVAAALAPTKQMMERRLRAALGSDGFANT